MRRFPIWSFAVVVACLVLLAHGRARQDRAEGDLKVGSLAPDFSLAPRGGGGAPVTLSSFRGESPVALIFGSYT